MNKMKAKTILTTILILLASLQLSAQKVKYPETPVFQNPGAPGLREVYYSQDDTDIHNFLYSYDLIYRIPYCVAYMLHLPIGITTTLSRTATSPPTGLPISPTSATPLFRLRTGTRRKACAKRGCAP